MFYIYILLSLKDNRTYVGYTKDISKRLEKHNAGSVKSTRHRTPLELIFLEQFETSLEAKRRELWWKSSQGRKQLKKIYEDWTLNRS